MAKTTKQTSAPEGKAGAEPVKKKTVRKKTAVRKVAAKKTSSTSARAETTAPAEKAVAREVASRKTATKKPAASKKAASDAVVHRQISSAERHGMIAEAAYLRGEAQGFVSDAREDWLLAEAEVDGLLSREQVLVSD